MSYMRVKHNDGESVNLRDFFQHHHGALARSTTSYTNNSNTLVYEKVRITEEKLGEGSTGVAYKANYDDGGEFIQCVVKLPTRLLRAKQIQVSKENGKIIIVNKKQRGIEYKEARGDLNYEWENFLLLHFGKKMRKHKMGTPNWSVSAETLESIIEEMNTLKTLNGYKNIHRILFSDPEVPLLVSEYFNGTVEEFSLRLETFGYKTQIKQIFECIIPQTLAGLHYMHSKNVGLAHMDIKPMNMLYKFVDGQQHPLVVLCDFGLCQLSKSPSNLYMGTPYFMAPEICKKTGSLYIPKYTDVYSWAVSMLCAFYPRAIDSADDSLVDELLLRVSQTENSRKLNLSPMQHDVFQNILKIIEIEKPKKRYKKFKKIYEIYNPK